MSEIAKRFLSMLKNLWFLTFFGKTPVSKGDEIRPASAVNVFGKLIGDSSVLRKTKDGEDISIEKD